MRAAVAVVSRVGRRSVPVGVLCCRALSSQAVVDLPSNLSLSDDFSRTLVLSGDEEAEAEAVLDSGDGLTNWEVDVLSLATGETMSQLTLDSRVFGVPIRPDLAHRVVKWQLSNRRTTAYKTKGIDETRGGGRKPFRQKGTGRARTGSIRAAQWRGGNKAPAVFIRDWSTKLPKKVRTAGLKVALSSRFADRRLTVLDDFVAETQKTQDLLDVLEAHPWADDRSLLVYAGDMDDNFALAARNVRQLNLIPACGLNVYDILKHDNLVFSQQALDSIYERLLD